MPAATLVAYATRSGATQEVAEAISGTLRAAGLTTELARMEETPAIDGYSSAVLGAPLYMGRLLKEFHEFVERFRIPLSKMQVWCFVLGPVENKPEQFVDAERQALAQFARHGWLIPMDIRIFGGRWDVQRMGFPWSLLKLLPEKKLAAMDARDWDAIRQWSKELGGQIAKQRDQLAI